MPLFPLEIINFRRLGMNIILVCLAGLLFCVSFPEFSFSGCAFFCMVPFFAAIARSRGAAEQLIVSAVWTLSYVAFMGNWLFVALVGHYGVSISTSILFVFLFVFLPLFFIYTCFVFAFRALKTDTLFFYAAVVPGLWILTEYIKARVSFLVPWIDIGYAVLPFHHLVQIADIAGVYGVSFLLILVNTVLWRLLASGYKAFFKQHAGVRGIFNRAWGRANAAYLLLLVAVFCFSTVYGMIRVGAFNANGEARNPTAEKMVARVVQGSFSMSDRWSGMGLGHRLTTYLELSGKKRTAGEKQLVVWPETVLNESAMINDDLFRQLMKWFGPDTLLVAGGVSETGRDVHNSAYLVSGQGRLLRYDKHFLLPYAEAVPPIDLLGRYYSAPEHYRPGRTPLAIRTPEAVAGVSICLEILYPGFIRQSVANGAQFLVNISNDSWFGDTSMPYIHFAAARMRAIENRRYVVRSANSGISGIIAPTGRVEARIPLFLRKSTQADILLKNEKSTYARFGDWLVLLVGCLLAIASVRSVIRS